MILLDTNLLVRMTRSDDPQSSIARAAIQTIRGRDEQLVIVPQNLYEFWTVATRAVGPPPAGQNGLGMSPSQAGHWLRFFQRWFALLPDRAELTSTWQNLIESYKIIGYRAHDARLMAAMQCYGITRILTFNAAHFSNLPVAVLDPNSP